jgi:hypothetical protein
MRRMALLLLLQLPSLLATPPSQRACNPKQHQQYSAPSGPSSNNCNICKQKGLSCRDSCFMRVLLGCKLHPEPHYSQLFCCCQPGFFRPWWELPG